MWVDCGRVCWCTEHSLSPFSQFLDRRTTVLCFRVCLFCYWGCRSIQWHFKTWTRLLAYSEVAVFSKPGTLKLIAGRAVTTGVALLHSLWVSRRGCSCNVDISIFVGYIWGSPKVECISKVRFLAVEVRIRPDRFWHPSALFCCTYREILHRRKVPLKLGH